MSSRDVSMPEPAADNNHADDHGLGVVEGGRHANRTEQCQSAGKKQGRCPKLIQRLQTEQMKSGRERVYGIHVAERSQNYAKSIGTADEENRHSRGQRASSLQLKCRRSL